MAVTETQPLVARLRDLAAGGQNGTRADVDAMTAVVEEIRAAVTSSEEPSDDTRRRSELLDAATGELDRYRDNGADPRHLEAAVESASAACADEAEEDEESYPEILGNILIVGCW